LEGKILARRDFRFGEQRIIRTEPSFLAEISDPFDDDVTEVIANRKEDRREGLRVLRADFTRVLVDDFPLDVDVLETKGDNRTVAGS
jgi:hypothetical protein